MSDPLISDARPGCPSCGIQLNADGTVDALPGEPDQHYADCTARFVVVGRLKIGELTPQATSGTRYGMARDDMLQRRAMSGARTTWSIEVVAGNE